MDFKNPQPSEIAERSVLGGILHHGQEAYLDVADIITPDSFTNDMNKVIYNCIRQICEKKAEGVVLDPGLVLSASQECGYGQFFTEKKHAEYLRGLFNFGGTVDINNIRTHGAKIRKLQIARDLQKAALQSVVDLGNINGTEEIEKICFLAEEHIIQEMDKLFGQGHNDIKDMGEGLSDFVQNLIENPQDSFGIPNQYVEYCRAIGGGHIRKELDIIAARAKQGKSFFADNIGFYIAEKFNIPVINIDTELSQEQHWIRLLGIISGVDMNEIKTGQFAKDPEKLAKVRDAEERIKKVPYKYECIGHRSFEDALAILRRWVNKHVGIDENGRRNDCLIIYDYIKLLSEDGLEKNMAEYQKLGFLVTALKNFLIRYDVPCLAFAQLNRDGIDGDSTAAMAGSDRILMYCSSLAFFKPKTLEEMAIGTKYGNRKMHVVAARNGPGTDEETYLHMQFDKNIGRITEVCTQAKVKEEENYKKAFGYEGDDDEDIELPN